MNEIIFTVTESLDGGFEAQAVGYSIFTQCDNYSQLPDTLRDAVKCHFDTQQMPSTIRIHLVKDEIIAV
ncbi:MAG: 2-oxoisovalerate dehydrogenase [Defluviitaleaceae bacterium]|nr:2-oxoisovalerate dehydrogenase [Defluviitaleaceae bacterium]